MSFTLLPSISIYCKKFIEKQKSKIQPSFGIFFGLRRGKGKKIILSDERLLVDQRSWEVWALGRLLWEILLSEGNGFGGSLEKWVVFGIRLLRIYMGHILMDGTHPNGWDANTVVRWSHRCPWKAIAQVFQEFSSFVRLVVGNGEKIRL